MLLTIEWRMATDTIPKINTDNPIILPPSRTNRNLNAEVFYGNASFSTPESLMALNQTMSTIVGLIRGNATGECDTCKTALGVAQAMVWDYPWETSSLLINLCELFDAPAGESASNKNKEFR
jgi:hypothetical protein